MSEVDTYERAFAAAILRFEAPLNGFVFDRELRRYQTLDKQITTGNGLEKAPCAFLDTVSLVAP